MTYRKLKPCPWCGRQTSLASYGKLYFVTCGDGELFYWDCGRVAVIYYDTAEKAIEGWNNNEVVRGTKDEQTKTTLH